LITAQSLPDDREVRIQYPNARGDAVCCKRLPSGIFKPLTDEGVVATNELADASPQVYSAEVPKAWSESPFVGLAAVGRKLKARNSRTGIQVREGAGRTHTAMSCFSKEGMHLIERSQHSERTHLYLSLGYELERPTCPE
jgi:hypothetical protein